ATSPAGLARGSRGRATPDRAWPRRGSGGPARGSRGRATPDRAWPRRGSTRQVSSDTGRPVTAGPGPGLVRADVRRPRAVRVPSPSEDGRRAYRRALRRELDALDRHVVARSVARVAVDVGDRVDNVHSLDDLPEDGVLPVEPGARVRGDD